MGTERPLPEAREAVRLSPALRGNRALAVALFLLTALVFSPAVRNGFVLYDDPEYVTENSYVRRGVTLPGLRWAFADTQTGSWHPLTWFSHMLDVELFGLQPAGHHLVSGLLHAATTAILFLFLNALTGRRGPSAVVALLFGLHPLHVESVAWASERKDVLSAFFWFLAAAAHLGYARRPGPARYLAVLLLAGLAFAAKPMAIMLPFTLVLLDAWPLGRWLLPPGLPGRGRRPGRFVLLEKLPLFALAAGTVAITLSGQRNAGAVSDLAVVPPVLRAANALTSYGGYLLKTVWPAGLAVFYPYPFHSHATAEVLLGGALLVAASAGALLVRRRHPAVATGWFWYLGTLLPVIGFVQIGAQAMADRYAYVPLVGIFIILAWEGAALLRRHAALRRPAAAGVVVLLVLLATLTVSQVRRWKDTVTLFEHATRVTSGNYLAHLNLGVAFARANDLRRAEAAFAEASRIVPQWDEPHYQLGALYVSFGQKAPAEREYLQLRMLGSPQAESLRRLIAFLPDR